MASNGVKASYLTLWSLLDLGVMTTLYPQQFYHYGNTFWTRLIHYSVFTSMFDIWIFSLIRLSMVFGALLGYLRNTTDGAKRVRSSKIVIIIIAVIMWNFAIIKLLLWNDHDTLDKDDPFFWAIFGWSLLTPVIFVVNWRLLGTFQSMRRSSISSSLSVNAGERRRLLDTPQDNAPQSTDTQTEDEDKIKPVKYATISRLLSYSTPDWPLLTLAFFFLLVSSSAAIFTPWYTGEVIDGIAITKDKARFTRAIILMSLFSAGSALAAGLRGGCFLICMSRFNMRIRRKLFSSLLAQEIGFFDVTKTGEITSRLTADTTIMSDTLGLNINVFLRSVVTSIGVCVFMFKLSWQLSMVTVIGLPLIIFISKVYGEYYESLAKKVQDMQAKANEVAEEVCSSMKTVRSFAGENGESRRYDDRLLATYQIQKKQAVAYAGYSWSNNLFELSLVVATLYYGGHLVLSDRLTGGNLVSFILYQIELGSQLENIANVYTGLMQATGASDKVFEFISRQPVIPNNGQKVIPKLDGRLEFRNVTFSYPSRPDVNVLKNISFTVEPGEVVALVGPSGGGKSTCIGLCEHFYETDSGEVLLDGIPIKEYEHDFLHEKISLVGQEPVLYARTIEENIAYGLSVCDPAVVRHAAKLANAHGFVMELKDKYQTQAGEKGLQLSGGQKQRVAIARALIRNPSVLLLDEATSALDAESEHVVQDAIYKNLSGHTVIIVAHRLSTVERANRIIVINHGEVVEQGSHLELLKKEGLYAKLVQRQLLAADIRQLGVTEQDSADTTGTPLSPKYASVPPRTYGSMGNHSNQGAASSASYDGRRGSNHIFSKSENVSFLIGSPSINSMDMNSPC